MKHDRQKVSYDSSRDIFTEHGLIVAGLYWVTEVGSWLSIGHWLRALPRKGKFSLGVDLKTDKVKPWWQDAVSIIYLIATPFVANLAWNQSEQLAFAGSLLSVYVLYDPVIYHVRVLWFDDLKPGIVDSRRGVWSHRRILFVAIIGYIQSVLLFPAIYRRVASLSDLGRDTLQTRSLNLATSFSFTQPITAADIAQMAITLFFLVIVIATTASIAYSRDEFSSREKD